MTDTSFRHEFPDMSVPSLPLTTETHLAPLKGRAENNFDKHRKDL